MATGTAYGTNYTLKATPKVGTWPNAAACNGELYCLSEECYATGAGVPGSVMRMGKLPVGAVVQFTVLWPIDSGEVADGGAAMAAAVAGDIGITGDTNLFGSFTDLTSVTPQVIGTVPDGTTYTSTLDFALRAETDVIITTTGAQNLANTEGIAMKMFYTMAGQTY